MATYKIVRMHQRDEVPSVTLKTGLTLDEATAHCSDLEKSSNTATSAEAQAYTAENGPWFDCWYMEVPVDVDVD